MKQPPCPGHAKPSHSCAEHAFQDQLHGISANFPYKSVHYGRFLENRKAFFNGVFEQCGIREERRGLMLAMAMIEASHLDSKQIDHSKDNFPDKSANASIFNLNEDMLRELGYRNNEKDYRKVIRELNGDGALPAVVRLLNQAFDKWGVVKTLYWVRGGRTTFMDGTSYDAQNYLRAVATSLRLMDEDPLWLINGHRIEMNVAYQTHDPKTSVGNK